jgi:hypothetical protein
MTNNTKSEAHEAHEAYVANRREAGRVIDIETCEIIVFYCNYFDPYESYPFDDDPPDHGSQKCRDDWSPWYFVRSEESGGWICELDLPPEKRQAIDDPERIPRRRKRKLWEAARAAHPMYEIKWKGDGEEPSRDALIEWFKVNHPARAREVRARVDAHDDLDGLLLF